MGPTRWINTLCPAGLTHPYSYVCTCIIQRQFGPLILPTLQLTNLSAVTSAPKQPLHSTWSTVISSERRHEAAVCARQFAHAAEVFPSLLPYPCDVSKIDFSSQTLASSPREAWSVHVFLSFIKLFPPRFSPCRPDRVRCCVIGLEQGDQP